MTPTASLVGFICAHSLERHLWTSYSLLREVHEPAQQRLAPSLWKINSTSITLSHADTPLTGYEPRRVWCFSVELRSIGYVLATDTCGACGGGCAEQGAAAYYQVAGPEEALPRVNCRAI